jgi:hypothetical protein
LAEPYGFEVIDATRPPVEVFESLKASVSRIFDAPQQSQAEQPRKPAQRVQSIRAAKAVARRD